MKKHFIFLRNTPRQIAWGGLDKLVCQWFEHIDYGQCRVSFMVGLGWREIYQKAFAARQLPIEVIEVDFDCSMNCFKKFFSLHALLSRLKPGTCIFLQGRFFCFHFAHILAAWLACGGEVFIHENLAAPKQYAKSSKKYFGFIPGLALWWYAEKTQARLRACFCKKILAVSEGVKTSLIDLWDYPGKKVLVCYHGIDLQHFSPGPKHLRGKVIVVAARLSQEKCIDRAINAFDALADLEENSQLLILGSGPMEADLKNLASRKRNASRIRFMGHVEDVSGYLKTADYFVLPSDNEGLGLSLLEAMSSGLICMATRCAGPMEIIQDGVNGFFIDKSSQGVREGLQKAFSLSVQQQQQMANNAVEFVTGKFRLNENIKKVFNVLELPYA